MLFSSHLRLEDARLITIKYVGSASADFGTRGKSQELINLKYKYLYK